MNLILISESDLIKDDNNDDNNIENSNTNNENEDDGNKVVTVSEATTTVTDDNKTNTAMTSATAAITEKRKHNMITNSIKCFIQSSDKRYKHVQNHLKKKDGDTLRIGIVNKSRGIAKIKWKEIDNGVVDKNNQNNKNSETQQRRNSTLELSHFQLQPLPTLPTVEIILCIIQPKDMKRLWITLSSLGVSKIIICDSTLSDKNYWSSSIYLRENYESLLLEGLAQSSVPIMPQVQICYNKNICDVIKEQEKEGKQQQKNNKSKSKVRIGLDIDESVTYPTISSIIRNHFYKNNSNDVSSCLKRQRQEQEQPSNSNSSSNPRSNTCTGNDNSNHVIQLLIGPERGFTEKEVSLMKDNGHVMLASMGPCILKTEIACIGSISTAMDTLNSISHEGKQQKD